MNAFLKLFVVLVSFASIKCADRSHWMSQYLSLLGPKKLNEVFLPGTHISASYKLIDMFRRDKSDDVSPDLVSLKTKTMVPAWSPILAAWSRTQSRTFAEQLADGIRVFDMRVCVERTTSLFRMCNHLYGELHVDVLAEVRTFVADHPFEIVFLNYNRMSETGLNLMERENHKRLMEEIKTVLGGVIVNHTQIVPTSTMQDVWQTQSGRSVVIFYDYPQSEYWDYMQRESTYEKSWDMDTKHASIVETLNRSPLYSASMLDFVAATEIDERLNDLSFDKTAVSKFAYPANIEEMAQSVNPVILGWILNEWSTKRLNQISVDFYEQTCLVNLTLHLNGVSDEEASLENCSIGATTFWKGWHAARLCLPPFVEGLSPLYCRKPVDYGRGVGYPWKFGDKVGNDAGQFGRCEKDNGVGNCEKWGAIVYPKCKPDYHNVACCMCTAVCPAGMTEVGAMCEK